MHYCVNILRLELFSLQHTMSARAILHVIRFFATGFVHFCFLLFIDRHTRARETQECINYTRARSTTKPAPYAKKLIIYTKMPLCSANTAGSPRSNTYVVKREQKQVQLVLSSTHIMQMNCQVGERPACAQRIL